MTTTVMIAGQVCQARKYQASPTTDEWTHYIDGGDWLQTTITARVTALINEQRATRLAAGLPTRDVVDVAMRAQRLIDAHWRLLKTEYDNGMVTFRGAAVDLNEIASAVEELLAFLPEVVTAAFRP